MTIWHSIVMPDCHGRPDWSARRVWSNNIDSLIDNVSLAGRAVGRSPDCRDLLKKAIQIAATDVTTCLQGESADGEGRRGAVHPPRLTFVLGGV
jgi:hypothetical protein